MMLKFKKDIALRMLSGKAYFVTMFREEKDRQTSVIILHSA